LHVVMALACCVSPADIGKELKALWGIEVSKQLLTCYDPTTRTGAQLRQELKDHFHQTRRDYLARIRQISTADQSVRLARLDQIFNRYMESGNLQAARETLKQIAEEVGGKYTNAQTHTIKGDARENLAAVLGLPVEALPKPRNKGH